MFFPVTGDFKKDDGNGSDYFADGETSSSSSDDELSETDEKSKCENSSTLQLILSLTLT